MVTDIGLELKFDMRHSGTENLYYQLFGEWPKHDCVDQEAKELLLELLRYNLHYDNCDSLHIFFGIESEIEICRCVKGESCRKTKCPGPVQHRCSKKSFVVLQQLVTDALQELRFRYAMEIKMLYLDWDPRDLYIYSVVARNLDAQRTENQKLKKELEELRDELQRANAESTDLAAEKAAALEKSAELETLRVEFAQLRQNYNGLAELFFSLTRPRHINSAWMPAGSEDSNEEDIDDEEVTDEHENSGASMGSATIIESNPMGYGLASTRKQCASIFELKKESAKAAEVKFHTSGGGWFGVCGCSEPGPEPEPEPEPELFDFELFSQGTVKDLKLATVIHDKLSDAGIDDLDVLVVQDEADLRALLTKDQYLELAKELKRRRLNFVDRKAQAQLLAENKLENLGLSWKGYWSLRLLGIERLDQLLSMTYEDLKAEASVLEWRVWVEHDAASQLMERGLKLASVDQRSDEELVATREAKDRAFWQFLDLPIAETDLCKYERGELVPRLIETVGQFLLCPFPKTQGRSLFEASREMCPMDKNILWEKITKRIGRVPAWIEYIGFDVKVDRYLWYRGFSALEDLTSRTEREIYQLFGFEYEIIAPMRELIAQSGLEFRKETPIDQGQLRQLLCFSLSSLGLPNRSIKILKDEHRIIRIGDLIGHSPEELLGKYLVGPRMVSNIERGLYQLGLILRYECQIREWADFYRVLDVVGEGDEPEAIGSIPLARQCIQDLYAIGFQYTAELLEADGHDLYKRLGWDEENFRLLETVLAGGCVSKLKEKI